MEILSGIISKVIEYTVEPVGRQVGYLINYKSNLESVRSQLKNLNAAKDRMKHRVDEVERNGKGVETDVQNWRTEADGITQEAEKILGIEGQAKTKCFHGVCPNLVKYHQFSRKSAKLANKIELHAQIDFPSVSYEAPVEDICAIPSQEYMAFQSRAPMLKEIMEELKNPDTNKIGVYGLGGVGKTTLAKEVFRQANKEKLFDEVVIILNVKEKMDMDIQKEIAEKLGMEVKEPQSMAVRANCLWGRIKDKKTLVILDDVLGRIDLEAVGLVPVRTCNLLLTSRDKEVLFSEMGTQKNFQLDLLCEPESLSLFEKRAGTVIKDDRIEGVANELAKKCGGLPILVVAVASGLRESSLEEWKDTLRRFKNFEKKGLAEIAFLIIEWSYNQLDSEELKRLFLLCAIMAEGTYAFSLSDLLKYTIGLGLFKNVRTVEEARNALHSLVKKLKDSCLLLDGYDDGNVRMHDVVRDVAVRIASRDQHVLSRAYTELDESPSKDCSLISLQRCTIPKLPDVPWECPELNLFYLGSSDNSLEIPWNFFEEMKELKVLDLTGLHFPSLPPSLQSLTNLQTLCLDNCMLGDIALVGQLTNLKILSLLQSQVKELPKEIGQLTRLQLLDLSDCSELVLISPGVISSLTSLGDLRMGSFKKWEGGLNDGRSNASVSELKQLRQLTALDIHIPDAKLLPANMFSDTRLERYTILIGDCWQHPDNYETSSNMLKLKLTTNNQFDQGIQLLIKRCEHLDLDGMEAANIISYLLASDSGKQLKNLLVQNNDEVTAVIDNLVNLETVCCGQLIAQPFQKLRSLTLRNLPKLIGFSSKGSRSVVSREAEEIILENEIGGPTKLFMNGEVMMPNLTSLIVHGCSGLRFLFSFSMARSLVQLTHLEIASCEIMEEIVTKTSSSEENTDDIFRKLKHLQLQHLPSLTRFCSGSYVEFPSLELLHLEDCSELGVFIFHSKSENVTVDKQTEETDVQYFLLAAKVGFPSLESLIICDLPKLRTIWHRQLAPDSFRKLETVTVLRCQGLINIFTPSMMGRLNALDTLNIEQCKSLQVVFEQTYDTSTTELKTFECPNLYYIEINSCESLKNIFPASVAKGLQQLRELNVRDCGILEEIVAKEGVETTPIEEFVFPKVTLMKFVNLPQLRSFYPRLHVSKWPLLKYMEFFECGKVEIFASEYSRFQERLDSDTPIKQPLLLVDKGNPFPNLETLELDKNIEIWYEAYGPLLAKLFRNLKYIRFSCAHPQSFHFLENLHNLEELVVYNGPWKEIFVYEGTSSGEIDVIGRTLPHVKNLYLNTLEELMHLGIGNDNSESVFPNLEILKLYHCGRLKNLTSSAISFHNLTTLQVEDCMGLKYLVTYSVAKCLHQLKSLEVEECESMIEIVASNEDEEDSGNYYEIAFSSLQHLELSNLPSLQGFCSSGNCTISVPSLNSLIVEKCLIELKISLDGSLIQSSLRPERLQITEEVEEAKEKEED
ncbi:disease resistance protein At4g27190-like [Prunus dulcis]|uniref:disease resistance protein At4g27190-like n=1 Tax=Prunus dulcis TaxID=3755 RepID=UPI001482AB5C|nr:disease resistance protein At4g27190-like [Prunus dulcis]